MKIQVKRVYEEAGPKDGLRILVDRLWPRGLSKDKAHIDLWIKTVAPSQELRRWFQHEVEKWPEFKKRYFAELDRNPEAVEELTQKIRRHKASLLFGSKEERYNNAVALKEYLESHPES